MCKVQYSRVVFILLGFMVVIYPVCALYESELTNQCNDFYNKGDYTHALDCYNTSIALDNQNYFAWLNLGNTYLALNDPENAYQSYRRTTELNPNFAIAWNNLGKSLTLMKRYNESIDAFKRAIAINPDDKLPYFGKGNALYAMNNYPAALDAYDQSILRDANYSIAWNGKGNALYQMSRFCDALDSYQKALKLNPNNEVVKNNIILTKEKCSGPKPPPSIRLSPSTLSAIDEGISHSERITASGGTAPYTYRIVSGALPAGLTLSADGTISGIPTTPGTYDFRIDAIDANTFIGSMTFSLTIRPKPTIKQSFIRLSPSTLSAIDEGISYAQRITASDGTAPYSYRIGSGVLPAGLTLSVDGTISGIPTTRGSYDFRIDAIDANTFIGSMAYSLTIKPKSTTPPSITLSPSTLSAIDEGISYAQRITASGGTSPYTYRIGSGALPTGLILSADGTISGIPKTNGTYDFRIDAIDANTLTGSRTYSLTIKPINVIPMAMIYSLSLSFLIICAIAISYGRVKEE